jgi:hypothetical protein
MKPGSGYPQQTYNPSFQRFNSNPGYSQDAINAYLSQQMQPAQQIQANFFKGRPVASIDEARAAQIDFDGSLYIFTDLGKGKIYTKQFNPDGTVTLNTFAIFEEKEPEVNEYVTKDEFNLAINEIRNMFGSKENQTQKKVTF